MLFRSSKYVHSVAVGMQNLREIEDNCAYFSGKHDVVFGDTENQKELRIHDWCTCCASCVDVCKNGALRVVNNKIEIDNELCVLCGYCGAVCSNFAIKVI